MPFSFFTTPREVPRTGDDSAASSVWAYVWRTTGWHQAAACGVEPEVEMNPVLLKPGPNANAHIVAMGEPLDAASPRGFQDLKPRLREVALDALATLRARYDVVICEGAGSPAEINLRENDLANLGIADAAGLPILPGLARYSEVRAGEIDHALRFTASRTRRAFIYPARHFASDSNSANLPPMGLRVRLKRSVSLRGHGPQAREIIRALKRYGMILADNGSSWYLSGAPDDRWDNDDLGQLKSLTGSMFEFVDVSSLQVAADSMQAAPEPAG